MKLSLDIQHPLIFIFLILHLQYIYAYHWNGKIKPLKAHLLIFFKELRSMTWSRSHQLAYNQKPLHGHVLVL